MQLGVGIHTCLQLWRSWICLWEESFIRRNTSFQKELPIFVLEGHCFVVHPVNEGKSLVFFIQKEEEALISLRKSAGAIEGCISVSICIWYKSYDHNYKTPETLIRNLLDIASKGGNFLLNVGPTNLGEFPEESVDILQKMGQWMKINGEAVYGTKASPWGLFSWGRCTKKENRNGIPCIFLFLNGLQMGNW